MINYILQYLIVLFVFLVIDLLWVTVIAKKLYADKLGYIMREKVKMLAAFAFYLIYVFGLMVFIILPAMQDDSVIAILTKSMLFGFIAYGTYDFTNYATIKQWPLLITIVDVIWGAVLTGSTCLISSQIIDVIF